VDSENSKGRVSTKPGQLHGFSFTEAQRAEISVTAPVETIVDSGGTYTPPTPTYTWIDGTSGDWGTAADWSGGVVPDGTSNAVIAGSGTETVTVTGDQAVNVLTLNNANATLAIDGGISIYGGLVPSAVHEIDLSGVMTIFGGSQTLDNTTINAGNGGLATDASSSHIPAVLTLGPNLTFNVSNGSIFSGYATGDGIDNRGTINANGSLIILGNTITNEGSIIGSGDVDVIYSSEFSVATGATLSAARSLAFDGQQEHGSGTFTNSGTISSESIEVKIGYGGFVNDGNISGSDLVFRYGSSFTNGKSGTISAADKAIFDLADGQFFDNEGVISATNGAWLGLYLSSGVNDGTISVGSGRVHETAPTVAVSIDNIDVNVTNGTGTVTFAFSEAPVAFALSGTSAVGGTLSNLQQSDATHYTATFTGAANTDITNASVSVTAGSYQDIAGNAGAGGSTTAFTVDTVTPTVAYRLTILGGPNGANSIAQGINDAEQVVGYSFSFSGNQLSEQAVIWNGTTPTVLNSPSGTTYSVAQGISNAGQVVGYSQGGNRSSAVIWNGTTPTILNSLGGTYSQAVGINNAGQVVGVSNGQAVIWNGTTPTALNSPDGSSYAAGINNAGQVVGEYDSGNGVVIWNSTMPGTTPTVLNSPPGTTISAAGINNAGQVAGNLNGGEVIWNGTTPTVLGRPYGLGSFATGINDAGQVVGVGSNGHSEIAVIWNGTTPTDLNTVLEAGSLDLLTLEVASGINSNGDIVGYGENSSGLTEAFLLTPVAPMATAPESWITGTLGDWSTGVDWLSGVVPSSTDDAVINSSTGVTVNGTAVAHSLALNDSTLTVSGTLTLGTSLTVDGNAQLTLSGGAMSAQSITSDSGTFGSVFGYGTVKVSGAVSGNVGIYADGGTLKVQGSLAGDQDSLSIDPGATLELSNGTAVSVNFGYNNLATLKLGAPTAFTGPIYNIVVGDTIDLAGITASSASYNGTTLTINDTNGQQLTYNVSGSVVGDTLTVASDNNGGTDIYWSPPVPTYTYTPLDDPLAVHGAFGTFAQGINDLGQIVGYYADSSGQHGFLYGNGTWTTLNYPSGNATGAQGINDLGQIVGYYDANSAAHGFLYSNGTWTTLNYPSGNATDAQGINDLGQIVGYYGANGAAHGFLYSNGAWTTLDDPSANGFTVASGINDSGQIVGYYASNELMHGFLYSNGTWTTLSDPSGITTEALGINDSGQIVGIYQDSNYAEHGFLYGNGTWTTLNYPSGIATIEAAINDLGQTAGIYADGIGGTHGFLATPTPTVINDGSELQLGPGSALDVLFAGNTGTLKLDDSSSFSGTVAGMFGQDTIDFADINPATVGQPSYSGTSSGGTLSVTDGSHSANIALLGNYLASSFVASSDGHGGTNVIDPPLSASTHPLNLVPSHA
jgi:probable HAF family extracellular repeat protein